jgi:hypothetical protein
MSDTPRTDAATLTEPYQVRELGFEVVKAEYMAAMERKLNYERETRKNLQHVIVSQWGVDLITNCIAQIREVEKGIGPLGPINDYSLAQILSSTIVLPAELKLKEMEEKHKL